MALGSLGAIGDGLWMPISMLLFRNMANEIGFSSTTSNLAQNISHNISQLLYLAMCSSIVSFLEGYCWTRSGERQATRMRTRYLKAILRQDVAYFDSKMTSITEVVNDISNDTFIVQDFLSEKVPNFIMNCTTFIAGYAIAFILIWRLALVAFPTSLLLIIPGFVYGRVLLGLTRKMLTEYNKAAVIAEQAVSSVRTVYAFRAERRTTDAFSANLKRSTRIGLRQGLVKGLALGSTGITFTIWSFMIWYSSRLVIDYGAKGGNAYAAGICIVTGGLSLGSSLSNVKYFGEAVSAAERINEVIGQRVVINSESDDGEEMEAVKGEVEFREVRFAYPTRQETEVVMGFSLMVPSGKAVALVGGSGSGKSTMILLLQRFYDPTGGEILLDGVDIRRLRLKWLRGQMGLVSQEPALFATTIKENILFGKEDATMEEVVTAAKAANASEFISQLPKGYDTQVGESGVQLSGGQKQRIAIARAIIRSPKILLLDEATSALDSMSELVVKKAFEVAASGRTTIVIAHRLSTIRNADTIAFIQSGKVIEFGSHDDLIKNPDGHYSSLVHIQESQLFSDTIHNSSSDAMSIPGSPSITQVHNTTQSRSLSYRFSPSVEPLSFSSSNWSVVSMEDDVQDAKMNLGVPSLWILLKLNAPEWHHAVLGYTGALFIGVVQPIFGYAVGSTTSIYFLKDYDEVREKARTYSLMFAALSVFCFVINTIQHYNIEAMGEYLTKRIRENMLSKMLTFEVSWFDQDENSTGALCSRLSKDANLVRSLVGDRLSLIIQILSSMIIAITMGLLIAWRLAIVIISFQPLSIISFYSRFVLLKTMSKKVFKSQLKISKIVSEAIYNLRIVTAFSSQDRILRLFELAQVVPHRNSIRQSWLAGAVLGSSTCITICGFSLAIWYGGLLVANGSITKKAFFQTLPILMSTSRAIAEIVSQTSDLSKGASTISSIYSILDRTTLIEPDNPDGRSVESLNGDIQFQNVDFAYPSRPNVLVLNNFTLSLKEGRSTALVGTSGSGKSTIIGLIQRFYDPLRGLVLVDGNDIKSYNLRSLRRHIALVGQEPVLFAGTVMDNIIYGMDEGISNLEIEAAARAANAHDFICNLPNGYKTSCGDRGMQLSGGQKQRIAIARALLCNPVILLLDEATSALDRISEMVVLEALEKVMVGRTTLMVAHRLSTVKNCDVIAVMEKGALVEKGSHTSLMKRGPMGKYYGLVSLQG